MHPNFGDLFWRAVRLYPDRIAIEQGDIALTYAQLEQRTRRAARLLAESGVGKGDKVLLMLPNDYRFAEILFGALRTGAVVVPANVKLGVDALAYVAEHSESRVLVGHADLADKIAVLIEAAPVFQRVFMLDGGLASATDYETALAAVPPEFETVPVAFSDIALLMYTSGSTGRPKGCLLSHESKWFNAQSNVKAMLHDETEKALITGPLYHANALWGSMLPMLYVGGAMAILPGFDALQVIAAIDRYKPTFMSGTPSMFSLLLAQREALAAHDTSSINLLMCGSAPVPEELMNAIQRQFRCEVCETYGLTEAGANVLSPRWGIKKLGSTGLPAPGFEVRIVSLNDETRNCAPYEVGELWGRSPANATGYYKQPDVTAERITPDGWLRTGDLMMADEQGYIYFRGRRDDMINVGGENLYPKEVETILLTHPAVADVCVVPAPHKVKGQAPVAWVVLHTGAAATEDELKSFFLDRGPAYAHPRRVFFIDVLPVSGNNKVDRKFLTEEAARRLPDGLGG
ncbi:MAG: acyl--CoA ligase [Anaerolineae bacterium]|nr:acyl--CoA ligase [Anaerolineae bacterium]